MDLGYLLKILARRKWVILAAALGAALLTFMLVGLKSAKYKSSAILATGIVDYKCINSDGSDAFVQQYQIENAFSNLTEFVQSRSSLKILAIEMLQHDLNARASKGTPYRQPNKKLMNFTDEEEARLLKYVNKINLDSLDSPSFDPDFDFLLDKISRSYGYDHDQMIKALSVKRKGSTDYLTIEMTTEKPELSQYIANTYVKRLRVYYQNLALREKRKNVENFNVLANQKKWVVDSTQSKLFNYLRSKGIPVLSKQSEGLVSQLSELELAKQKALSKKKAADKSITVLDTAIHDKSSGDSRETRNRVADKYTTDQRLERVRQLKQKSIESGGKDEEIEAQLADAERALQRSIQSSARSIGKAKQNDESRRTKEELYKEKVSTSIDKIEAEESLDDIERRIATIRGSLSSNVAYDEISTQLRDDQNRAILEFDEVNSQLIKAKLELENYENRLNIVEYAQLPEWPEPDRQILLSVFAGIVAATLATILIFLLAYFDNSLQSPDLFKKFTDNLPLLGAVSVIPVKNLDLNKVFSSNGESPQYTPFRESLRKIRSQLIQSGKHIFLIVSAKPREGKTFTMHGLAYSLAANNKRVLMLDTNFKTPLPESYINQPTPNADFLNHAIAQHGLDSIFELKRNGRPGDGEANIDIIGNTGLHQSPAELLDPEKFKAFLQTLREQYDFIFMESAALNTYSDAQELLPYSDALIAVFKADSAVKPSELSQNIGRQICRGRADRRGCEEYLRR
jgi:capsular polysaccharide biosynthesis protein